MLKNAAVGITLRSLRQCNPILVANKQFHQSVVLLKNSNDCRPKFDCPKTKTEDCVTLTPRKCSPTNPPVRPCSEQDCPLSPKYSCCVSARIKENICEKPVRADQFKRKPDKFMSMWGNNVRKKQDELLMWDYPPECCPECPDIPFDAMYYRPSNKCRKYQRTWWECCPRMVPKRVCCWCDAVPPENSLRCLPLCPRSACTQEHEAKRLQCHNEKSKCPRLNMPCCRAARSPPRCGRSRLAKDCVKIKCPFPSFSECDQMDLAATPERPPECRCLSLLTLCEAFRRQQRMQFSKIRLCPCPTCDKSTSS